MQHEQHVGRFLKPTVEVAGVSPVSEQQARRLHEIYDDGEPQEPSSDVPPDHSQDRGGPAFLNQWVLENVWK
jgi:hypothetical protein